MYINKKRNSEFGFTLIELMIVVAILGIIAAIAIPNYGAYVKRGHRSEGRAALVDAAALQERYYSDCNQFAATLGSANNCATNTVNISTSSETGKYTISATTANSNQSFTLTATPTFTDDECGALTLTQDGTRTEGGTATDINDCWGK